MPALSLCVVCGSRPGRLPSYMAAAEAVGGGIAARDWRLVYGAGDVGLMGAVARAAQAHGAETFGVIPEHLVKMEVGKSDLSTYVVTENMHERKKVMFMKCDAVLVLPGGAGSLDEFFEVLAWAKLGLHAKPLYMLNVGGYWDPLAALMDHIVAQGFADASLLGFVSTLPDVPAVMQKLSLI